MPKLNFLNCNKFFCNAQSNHSLHRNLDGILKFTEPPKALLESYVLQQRLQLCQFCTKVPSNWSLKFGNSIKMKYLPDGSAFSQNIETSCKNKLKLIKRKDLCFKKRWM